jgi:branched-chain amino acid transport system ATP-binding protein
MLEIDAICTGYGKVAVLFDVSISVPSGKIVAVLGPNGAGKSTLLRCASGLLPTWSGSVRFDGLPIDHLPPDRRAALGLGHVLEGRGILQTLSVGENLDLGLVARPRSAGQQVEEDRGRLLELFPALAGRLAEPAGGLSGGQQQMLAVARAMMARPKVLLIDEASFGLSPRLVHELFQQISLFRDQGTSFLLVEQQAQVLDIADECVVLKNGRVVARGPAAELADPDVLRASYLGTTTGAGHQPSARLQRAHSEGEAR